MNSENVGINRCVGHEKCMEDSWKRESSEIRAKRTQTINKNHSTVYNDFDVHFSFLFSPSSPLVVLSFPPIAIVAGRLLTFA